MLLVSRWYTNGIIWMVRWYALDYSSNISSAANFRQISCVWQARKNNVLLQQTRYLCVEKIRKCCGVNLFLFSWAEKLIHAVAAPTTFNFKQLTLHSNIVSSTFSSKIPPNSSFHFLTDFSGTGFDFIAFISAHIFSLSLSPRRLYFKSVKWTKPFGKRVKTLWKTFGQSLLNPAIVTNYS